MRDTSKALLATLVAGLGASAVRMAFANRHTLSHHAKKIDQNVAVARHYAHDYYHQLTSDKQAKVNQVVRLILPERHGFELQVEANRYLQVLHYLQHRYEYHVKDASRQLGIPYVATYNITVALIKQHLLDHNVRSQNYVRKGNVKNALQAIKPQFHKYSIVKPRAFVGSLRDSIATNMYW